MYSLNYDEISAAGLDGYFSGVSINNLRLYDRGIEIPLEIRSADGLFNSGDQLRFWADHHPSTDSAESELVLSPWVLGDAQPSPLRFNDLNVDTTAKPASSKYYTEARREYEENLIFLNDRQLGDLKDHFYWARIAKWTDGSPSYYPDTVDLLLETPDILRSDALNAKIRVFLRGRHQYLKNGESKIAVKMNNNPDVSATEVFSNYYPTYIDLFVPASHFVTSRGASANTVQLQVLADNLPIRDWSLIDIDRVEVHYFADYFAADNKKEVFKLPFDQVTKISGFSSAQISVYDLSSRADYRSYSNLSITTPDAGMTYDVAFAPTADGEADIGYRVLAIEDTAFLKPTGLGSAFGYQQSLKLTSNNYDLIVIGNKKFLAAARDLIAERRSEGLFVLEASLDQIYAEFSHGRSSTQGIKDFLNYAYNNWAKKPRFALLLGDASFDPLGYLGGGNQEHFPPVPLLSGDYIDFGSDSWYVSPQASDVPFMSIGRIPASNQSELEAYIKKILDFENGISSPVSSGAKTFGFYSDRDTLYEGFSAKTEALRSTLASKNTKLDLYHKKLGDYADADTFMTAVSDDFNAGPLVLSFVGHGAADQWGDDVFNLTDAAALTNTKLPIVVGLNCSTGMFYDSDLSTKSLSEALVLKPNSGSIAYWGSTTLTVPEAQVKLTKVFYDDLSTKLDQGITSARVGDMILKSQKALGAQATAKDTLRSWVFLGDPSMQLPEAAYNAKKSKAKKDVGAGCGMVLPPGPGSSGPPPWIYLILGLPILSLLFARQRSQNHIKKL
jgi:hypothetical protein